MNAGHVTKRFGWLLGVVAVLLVAGPAMATVVFSESFEGYTPGAGVPAGTPWSNWRGTDPANESGTQGLIIESSGGAAGTSQWAMPAGYNGNNYVQAYLSSNPFANAGKPVVFTYYLKVDSTIDMAANAIEVHLGTENGSNELWRGTTIGYMRYGLAAGGGGNVMQYQATGDAVTATSTNFHQDGTWNEIQTTYLLMDSNGNVNLTSFKVNGVEAYTGTGVHAGKFDSTVGANCIGLFDMNIPTGVGFDQITVDATPEPATMALLAIGGTGAILRRRK